MWSWCSSPVVDCDCRFQSVVVEFLFKSDVVFVLWFVCVWCGVSSSSLVDCGYRSQVSSRVLSNQSIA